MSNSISKYSFYFIFLCLILFACSVNKQSETVVIGDQVWMTEDLNVVTYSNGDSITFCKNEHELAEACTNKTGAYCYLYFDSINSKRFSLRYNWYAVTDPRGLAPKGFRVATVEDWKKLFETAGGEEIAGRALKDDSWYPSNQAHGENTLGFTAKPGATAGSSLGAGSQHGFWWTSDSTVNEPLDAMRIYMYYDHNHCYVGQMSKYSGAGVRCIKNN